MWIDLVGDLLQPLIPNGVLRGHTNRVSACAFTSDGMLLASAGVDRQVPNSSVVPIESTRSHTKQMNVRL